MATRLESPVQRGLFWISFVAVVLSAIGLALNPDFSTGDDLTSKWFLVDWNGWHALSGFLLWVPGIAAALYSRSVATAYCFAAAGADVAPAFYALADRTPLGLLDFPNVASDIVLHFAFAAALLMVALPELRARRTPTP